MAYMWRIRGKSMACASGWSRLAFGLLALAVGTVVAGCATGNVPPEIEPVADQVAEVGRELRVELTAHDGDGDGLALHYDADVPDIVGRATLTRTSAGGLFRWTPLAADVGVWRVDFVASDGMDDAVATVRLEVVAALGERSAPHFRTPLGAGTTLDLARASCVELDIAIDDQDSASVAITQDEPHIAGAELTATGGLTAHWRWCPSAEQIAAADRYTLALSADDLDNPRAALRFLIVLRRPPVAGCSGAAPVVVHAPSNLTASGELTIDAVIRDDHGLGGAPLLYHATRAPGDPVDLTAMTPAEMILIDGDQRDGTWAADVPNPAAAGASATLHYVIVADDDDDPTGPCDHTTQAPARGAFSLVASRPAPPAACRDDGFEDNDGAILADARPALAPGAITATSCPATAGSSGDDEDWYAVDIAGDSVLSAELTGGGASDLDLVLVDSAGATVTASTGGESLESLTACLDPGRYYLRIHAYGDARNDYRLGYARVPGFCLR
jgi:hypothetical protein